MKTKIITSEGNVSFELIDGRVINIHPYRVYTIYSNDTVSFILTSIPKDAGQAIVSSRAEDLEVNGETYTIEQLPSVILEAFVDAGAQARAQIVDELPTSGRSNTIYLVPRETSQGTVYDEYIWLKDEQRWELLGDTSIEIDRYVTKQTYSAYTADTAVKIQYISGSVDTLSDEVSENAEVTSNALNYLNNHLLEEVARATSAETILSGAISDESSRASSVEEFISGSVDFVSGVVDTILSTKADTSAVTEAIEAAVSGKADTSGLTAYTTTAVTDALNTVVTAHTTDTTVHVTTEDKATWNAKQDVSGMTGYTTTAVTDALSGVVTSHTDDTTIHVTTEDKSAWNAKSDFSGSYTDLTDKPTIPTVPTSNTAFTNDAGYITSADITGKADTSAVTAAIDSATSGKADTSAVTAAIDAATSGKANSSDVYTKAQTSSSTEVSTALSSKQTTLTAGTGIDITNNVISVTGGGGGTVSTAITSGDTNAVAGGAVYNKFDEVEQVTARSLIDLSDRFGGLKLVKLTQTEYTNLQNKDANTLYVVI